MKILTLATVTAVVALAGCATQAPAPAGMTPGQFVSYECEGGKKFQARLAADGSTVRIRYEGGYELDSKGNGVYEGDGWKFSTQGNPQLMHNDKVTHKGCKRA